MERKIQCEKLKFEEVKANVAALREKESWGGDIVVVIAEGPKLKPI